MRVVGGIVAAIAALVFAGMVGSAATDSGAVTAHAPITFHRASFSSENGTLAFNSPATDSPLFTLTLSAGKAEVRHVRDLYTCSSAVVGPPTCVPAPSDGNTPADVSLASAQLTAAGPMAGGLLVVVSSDPSIPLSTSLAVPSGTLDALAMGKTLATKDTSGSSTGSAVSTPTTDIPAHTPFTSAPSSSASASGGEFKVLIFGPTVTIRGIGQGSTSYSETDKTGEYDDGADTTGVTQKHVVEYLEITITGGDLSASSQAPTYLWGDAISAQSLESVLLPQATGHFAAGGETYAPNREDTVVTGVVTLVPTHASRARMGDSHDDLAMDVQGDAPLAATSTHAPAPSPGNSPKAAGAAAAVGGAALGIALLAYFWPSVKWWATMLALPLYSRIERQEVLDHSKRDEIYTLIRAEPGIHAHDISSRANIGWGTTVYHLKLLEDHQLVVAKRQGRYKRFFVAAGGAAAREAFAALRNETTATIANYVRANAGTGQKELCEALGLAPSLVSWHIDRLEEAQLVKKVKDGRRVRYFAGPAWADLDAARAFQGSGASPTGAET